MTNASNLRSHSGPGTLGGSLVFMLLTIIMIGTPVDAQKPVGKNRPVGVPDGYVVTPFGYSHPSCVFQLALGDKLVGRGVVQHGNGGTKVLPACEYPRFTHRGNLITAHADVAGTPEANGWVEFSGVQTSTSYSQLTANWTVPPAPASNDYQTVYFFTGLMDYADVYGSDPNEATIIQPVLGWDAFTSFPEWSIASWNCCYNDDQVYSTPVGVSAGDTIMGKIGTNQALCPAGTLSCSEWDITTYDESSGKSTTLTNTTSYGQTFYWAQAGVLEAYGIYQCSDFPPNGSTSFYNVSLFDDEFNLISAPLWNITNEGEGPPPISPECNYGGLAAATSSTLYYGANPAVAVGVSGSGEVTSSPSGISCPGICSATFPSGTAVRLTASPSGQFTFSGWSGGCSGTSSCNVTPRTDSSIYVGASFNLPVGIINTVAGNGTSGYSGDGAAATSAELYSPDGVALDSAGNIYVADLLNSRIRKVATATGTISTVAGNGTSGYSGDGGAATSAEISAAYGLAVDSAGNIYIADAFNRRIRKVTVSTGIISTVAGDGTEGDTGDGGPATGAELNIPQGVAVDNSGNIYIADRMGNRVRKVTASTGIISTVAGNGTAGYSGDGGAATSAELYYPQGVAVDSAGNIYIADSINDRIRKVTASTGVISTVAGNGTGGFSGDGGSATSAQIFYPVGVSVDSAGNIYIADHNNQRIRKVAASTGYISTAAGDGTAGYSGDGAAATSAKLNDPFGVALDASGKVYIADDGNNRVRVVGVP